MSDSQITIFYSWQSDLPGSETRNIIQDSIKDAVRLLRDTVDIEADRDTKGEFGSPDIAQTIFSKIDDCNIFVADVSAVCRYEATDKDGNKKVKYMPNPNVMLELGYATHVVGWDNVICVLNADYGAPEDMPFDIASRRLTPFSLKDGKSKGEIKRYIKGVIQDTVENILENGKRVKTGFSDLRLGCYDDGSISNMLHPIEVSNSVSFVKHKTQILDESLKLVEQIRSMKITEPSELLNTEAASNADEKQTSNATAIIRKDGSVLTPVTSSLKLNLFKLQRVHIKDEDRNTIIELCKNYLGIDIYEDTDFFNIGNLERKYDLMSSYSYEGTKDEENKYNSIMMLENNLHRVRMLDWYATTFDGLFFIPLAIENASKVYDEDVDVYVKINKGVVEVIIPSKELINPDMRGLEGLIYEEDVIKELLMMPESSDISYDTDISYTLADSLAESQALVRAQFSGAGINGNPRYNSDDYGREIIKYIAMPKAKSNDIEFEFSIGSLRAKEKKWLGPALLINPLTDNFHIEYSIKSKNSDGDLSGIVTYTK
ncbi:hypothetical protein DWV56_03000 [Holdemanella biformis]|uniref:CD-NTase-associated protein 12/Pycsar effector protein TIR domain-containing protein n=1 Tax=Holdemanella biformis TaxID=1735 RepID=A0A413CWN8_9FIRM|nr:hypothetical protein [Holdemanella biformis]RGW76108.1 hypothetical protein DWV56_03000 [Holdemanella biformis]